MQEVYLHNKMPGFLPGGKKDNKRYLQSSQCLHVDVQLGNKIIKYKDLVALAGATIEITAFMEPMDIILWPNTHELMIDLAKMHMK